MTSPFTENVEQVREEIAIAAEKSGRSADSITLVAVTKYLDSDATQQMVAAGCSVLGESRPQVLWEKAEALAELNVEWHMIGHLQRNKVKRTVPLVHLIHSVDSHRLMESIHQAAQDADQLANILLEVNVSGEDAKHGFQPAQLEAALEYGMTLPGLQIRGLMCMAGLAGGPEDARREFAELRKLKEAHESFCTDNIELVELSMGMSNDFSIAIEEGATIVRVGSRLSRTTA